jgi:hypothetical protein
MADRSYFDANGLPASAAPPAAARAQADGLRERIEGLVRELDAEADRLPWGDKCDAKMNAASRLRAVLASPAPEHATRPEREEIEKMATALERAAYRYHSSDTQARRDALDAARAAVLSAFARARAEALHEAADFVLNRYSRDFARPWREHLADALRALAATPSSPEQHQGDAPACGSCRDTGWVKIGEGDSDPCDDCPVGEAVASAYEAGARSAALAPAPAPSPVPATTDEETR